MASSISAPFSSTPAVPLRRRLLRPLAWPPGAGAGRRRLPAPLRSIADLPRAAASAAPAKPAEKDPIKLWHRYVDWLYQHKELGLFLDVSRIGFTDEFFDSMEPRMQRAFQAMRDLEKGAIANPDEGRMVGHYWLRNPKLSPNSFLRSQIENTLEAISKFADQVISGKSFESEDVSPVGEKNPLFRNEDDVNLTLAYLAVTEDPIHGTDQKHDIYWQGVCNHFNNVLNGNPSRTPGSLKNWWSKYIMPHLQRMSGIVRSVESLFRSRYTQHDSWMTAKEKYYAVYKKPFNFDKCWDLVKHNPKFASNVDPYLTGSMCGSKEKGKRKKKVVGSSATITDLTEDSVDSLGNHGEDSIERPMGNKRALKARRLRDAGVVPINEKVHSMLTEMELKKSKEEDKLARKLYLEEKLAATRAHAYASKLQSDFYTQMMKADRTSREDKILYQSIEGLDEASKQYLLEQKNVILLRRRGL